MSSILGTQAVSLATSGVAIGGRARLLQVCTAHTASGDAVVNLYDRTTAPGDGDVPHCAVPMYGKNIQTIPVPGGGILFENGIYAVVPADTTANIFFEEM
jgi:hypothetical protein